MTGIVKWFNAKNGFGFVVADHDDYFFHWTDIDENHGRMLYTGDRVTFDPCTTVKGLSAANVRRETR